MPIRAAIFYPENKQIAISNLAVHFLYENFKFFPQIDIFVTESEKSLFSKRRFNDFDIIFTTVSYEYSMLNLVAYLNDCNIPLSKKEREKGNFPLFFCGGIFPTMNPAPFLEIFDAVFVGEGEKMIDSFETISKMNSFEEIFEFLEEKDFVFAKNKETATILRAENEGFCVSSNEFLHKQGNLFGNRFLIELNRSCTDRCSFCAASFVYKTYREANKKKVLKLVETAVLKGEALGLMGTSLNAVSYFDEILDFVISKRGKLSLSSLKIKGVTSELVEKLQKCGLKSMTLALESGSEETRLKINKPIMNNDVFNAFEILKQHKMSAKLYFIAGLPNTDFKTEIQKTAELIKTLSDKKLLTKTTMSFAAFSPKPQTPFQAKKMISKSEYLKFAKDLKKEIRKINKGINLEFFGYKESMLQTLIGRADKNIFEFLNNYAKTRNIKKAEKLSKISIKEQVENNLETENFPWRKYLWNKKK